MSMSSPKPFQSSHEIFSRFIRTYEPEVGQSAEILPAPDQRDPSPVLQLLGRFRTDLMRLDSSSKGR